jgi:hypothetical protein
MTAWAFSTLRHCHPALFDALLEQLAGQLSGGVEPQNIANSLWAFARVGHPLGVHTEPLVAAAKQLLPQMNQQELCNTAWALGVLGQLDRDTWQQFCTCLGNVQGVWRACCLSVSCVRASAEWPVVLIKTRLSHTPHNGCILPYYLVLKPHCLSHCLVLPHVHALCCSIRNA